MKTPLVAAVAMIVSGLLAAPTSGFGDPPSRASAGRSERRVPGELLVKFKQGASVQARGAAIGSRGHSMVAGMSQAGWAHVRVAEGETINGAMAAYRGDPDVEYVQPNFVYRTTAIPDDPEYGQSWALRNTGQRITAPVQEGWWIYPGNNPGTADHDMGVEKAWDHITDCSSVVVAVVDTGVNYRHVDLAANMWSGGYPHHGYDFVDSDTDPMDLHGHGTHVAGIIGAVGDNGIGTTGVCWKASIMAVRVLDAVGSGSTAGIVRGVNFAVANGAKVINMSLGGSDFDLLFSESIEAARRADVVVVVAAGNQRSDNDSGTTPEYPCSFGNENLLCVAALDQSFELASFSNWGKASVDLGAPGTNIATTWAGTNRIIDDPLDSGWTRTSTKEADGGGWGHASFWWAGGASFLVDPGGYPYGHYQNDTDDRAYKTFDLEAASSAVLTVDALIEVAPGDHFRVGYARGSGDPFAGTGSIVLDETGVWTYPYVESQRFHLARCAGSTCSIGFQIDSDAAIDDYGVAITFLRVETLTLDQTSHNTLNGTSMAAPQVAGVAALLRAYNPSFTYSDVVSALKNGGRSVPSLDGKTTTGKAVDAVRSLAYVNPPTGLTAVVE